MTTTEREMTPSEHAAAKRAEIQARAAEIGVDHAYVSALVEEFYRRIRAHEQLGPIFEDEIGQDWRTHLEKMKRFWASVVLNTGAYSGKPVPAHQKLHGVGEWHFGLWLDLFRETLADTAPTEAAAALFADRAERIATSLKLAMFDRFVPRFPTPPAGSAPR